MSKLLKKIQKMFKGEKRTIIKDETIKVVGTWLKQDEMKREEKEEKEEEKLKKAVLKQKTQNYKKVQKSTAKDQFKKVEGFLKGAKHSFTDDEFSERKEEILIFLQELKKQNHKAKM